MTLKQINELHDLCFTINMLATGKKNAPVVTYAMMGDNIFSPTIIVNVFNPEPFERVLNFAVPAEKPIDKGYRKNLKVLKDIKKRLEEEDDE